MSWLIRCARNAKMSSLVCVDASLILRVLVPAPFSEEAAHRLAEWRTARVVLVAPALLAFEVVSSLRRMVHLGALTGAEGEVAFKAFRRFEIRLSHRSDMFPLAWRLAAEFDRPRAYDASYLALAQLTGCALWTADERLFNAVRAKLAWVHWIGADVL